MLPTLTRDSTHQLRRRPTRPSTIAFEVDRPDLRIPASTPNMQSANLYRDATDPASQVHRVSQGRDVLSSGSSSLPYTQIDQPFLSDLSHSTTLNSNPHNAPLEILNAESYNFGSQDASDSKGRSKRSQVEEGNGPLPFGVTESSHIDPVDSRVNSEEHEGRQKKKARVDVLSDEDEMSKKARGRPRLDIKDKTAADRRRTQIRNAQRAYRSRKETTISSLESQVQEMRGTNEEMSNMFTSLYDFALGKGLLQREPEFTQRLISVTERCQTLAKAPVGDESSRDEELVLDNRRKHSHSKSEPSQSQEAATIPAASMTMPDPTSAWGYQISHEHPSISDDLQQGQDSGGLQQIASQSRDGTASQTVTKGAPENANYFDTVNTQNMQQYRAEVPSPDTYSQCYPQEFLPLPHSFAYAEKSFARRLHREGCERAYKLISAPNPPPKRLEKVFSLTLKYSSMRHIKARLERIVFSSARESLQAWTEPFVHVGGAGTHWPVNESDLDGMPKFRTGLSMGPFGEEVIATQENFMPDNMRTLVGGFEGEWFDPNDVENYLRAKGINILDDMQVTQVDLDALVAYGVSGPRSATSTIQTFSPYTPGSPRAPVTMHGDHLTAIQEDFGAFNTAESINFGTLTPVDGSTLPPSFSGWDHEDYGIASSTKTQAQDAFNVPRPAFDTISVQQSDNGISRVPDTSLHRKATLNVNTLLDNILANAVCLGRSPGFRPIDVDVAIHKTIGEAVST